MSQLSHPPYSAAAAAATGVVKARRNDRDDMKGTRRSRERERKKEKNTYNIYKNDVRWWRNRRVTSGALTFWATATAGSDDTISLLFLRGL